MAANILYFLLFAAAVIAAFYSTPVRGRKYVFLFANILFYWISAGFGPFVLLAALTLYSWYIAELVCGKGRRTLFLCLAPIVGCLAVCKYLPFFADSIEKGMSRFGLGVSASVFRFLLPLGISFYTLKLLSYVIDRWRGRLERFDLTDYCVYTMNFTQILSGPIQRPHEFLPQLSLAVKWDSARFSNGVYRILLGLFKKSVIADRCVLYVDSVFSGPRDYPAPALWLAAFLYTVELYADFSGYSDIAIGLMKLFGMETGENFRQPYYSSNIREFWSRWHISLSGWLRDYIYIPLGGNRCSRLRQRLNLLLTFAVSGAWHGNGWNYMLWGLLHGVYNLITPSKKTVEKINANPPLRVLSTLATFCCVAFGWIVFHAGSVENVLLYIGQMFSDFSLSFSAISYALLPFTDDNTCAVFALMLFLFIFLLFYYDFLEYRQAPVLKKKGFCVCWQTLLLVLVILFGVMGESGFLYAQF